MSLLNKLYNAVIQNQISSPFTTHTFKNWVQSYNIINSATGARYSDSYLEGFLSSSTMTSSSTKYDKKLIQHKSNNKPDIYHF